MARARALRLAGDANRAEEALASVARRVVDAPELLTELGHVHLALGRPDVAMANYARALATRPDEVEAITSVALIEAGRHQWAAARRRVDDALARHPGDADYLHAAVMVYAVTGGTARSRALLRQTLDARPYDLPIALTLVTPEFARESRSDAIGLLERLLERRPLAVAARERLADIYESAGRSADARRQYQIILAAADRPEFAESVARASARLKAIAALPVRIGGARRYNCAAEMALAPGTRIGVYEVLAKLGEGGMGEVYRAIDTSLARQVAIKVLPDAVAADAERLARFDREAKTLAALNHPNVAAIYGLERSAGANALVMELVEGNTLSDVIAEGAIPVGDALPIAKQIADALEAAHEQGIIHRDLKPANVKLRPDGAVKVLDFGLAKALESPGTASSSGASLSPTITSPAAMTALGVILGTAAYMSPEQARGKPADRRADIWAFGAVLYEMLTGSRAFAGDEITDTLAFIITKEPDWSRLPAGTPPAIGKLMRRCLEKDRKRRLADVADARLEIEEAMSAPGEAAAAVAVDERAVQSPRSGARTPWVLAAILLLTTAVLGAVVLRLLRPNPAAVATFTVAAPDTTRFHLPGTGPAASFAFNGGSISPDGRTLAFTAVDATGKLQLWLRPVASLTAAPVAGTDGALHPIWSPDGRFIAFFADSKLKKIDVSGGPPQVICDTDQVPRGAAWGRDGVIVFASNTGALSRVSAGGGPVTAATALKDGETAHTRPSFLPDGRHFIYRAAGKTSSAIVIGSLDSADTTPLLSADSQVLYSPPGYVLFVRQGTLLGQRFDADRLQVSGDPIRIAERVAVDAGLGLAAFSVSQNGVLTYRSGGIVNVVAAGAVTQLDWLDREGRLIESVGGADAYRGIELSPDGSRLGFHRHDNIGGDLWILDVKRGTKTRLTFAPEQDSRSPVWSPDGSRIAFASYRNGTWGLYQKLVDSGTSGDELLLATKDRLSPDNWTPDGKSLVYTVGQERGADIWLLPLTGDRKPVPLAQEPFLEAGGVVSPDGRWMAYLSNETGSRQVYVRAFPSGARKQAISNATAAVQPVWRRDGRELFYIDIGGRLTETQQYQFMAVDVKSDGAGFEAGVPRPLFTTVMMPGNGDGNAGFPFSTIDASADGQRFLITRPSTAIGGAPDGPAAITVVLNWTEVLNARERTP